MRDLDRWVQSLYNQTRGIRGMYDTRCIGIEIPLWDDPEPWRYTSSDIPYNNMGLPLGDHHVNLPLQHDGYISIIDSLDDELVVPSRSIAFLLSE